MPSLRLREVTFGADGETVLNDLRLGDVTVSSAREGCLTGANTTDSISFNYNQMSLTTTPLLANGAAGTPQSFGYDIATNAPIGLLPIAKAGSTVDGAGAQLFYLTVDGVDGGSTTKGHEGAFEVQSYSYASTSSARAPNLTPIQFFLTSSSGVTALLKYVATQGHIPAVRLEGVAKLGGPDVLDLRLAGASIGSLAAVANAESLSFNYSQIFLTTTAYAASGAPSGSTTAAYDVLANKASSDAGPIAKAGTVIDGAAATNFFLTIDGLDSGSTVKGHVGAFEIGDRFFDFGANVQTAQGGGSGRATFNPSFVDVTLGSGATELLQAAISGGKIGNARIVGDAANGATVYDLRFGDVAINLDATLHGTTKIAFDYSQVSLTTTAQNAAGSLGASRTFAYDVAKNTILASPLVAAVAGTTVDGSTPATLYLTVDGLNGGSTAKGHEGAFEVSTYNFGVHANGVGATVFGPLSVILNLGSGLTAFMRDVTTGAHLRAVRLEGVAASGGPDVYDLRLSDLVLSDLRQLGSDAGTLAFNYSAGSLTTTAFDANGTQTAQTVGFDAGASPATLGATPDIAAKAGGAVDGAPASIYYLTVDGVDGGSTAKGHVGAFEISSNQIDIANATPAVGTNGAGSSKPVLGPLQISFTHGSGLTNLLRDVATGTTISKVHLEGVQALDGPTVYDLRLGDVLITKLTDRSSLQDALALNFAQISLTTTAVDQNGALSGTPTTSAFDQITGRASTTPLPPAQVGDDLISDPATASIDVVPPPTVTESLLVDTGVSASDLLTSNPELTGTADPNSVIYFTIDGVAVVDTVMTDNGGVWTYTPVLSDGPHTVVASATNNVNLTGSAQLSFTLDTTTSESVIADAAVTIGGDGKPYINAAQFNGGATTLTGVAEADDTVVVRNGANHFVATLQADAETGAWSLPIFGLVNGHSYSYTATATDAVGNVAANGPFAFTVDVTTRESAIADHAVRAGADGKASINAARFHGGATTLTGRAEAGDIVVATDGANQVVGSVQSDARTGAWRLGIAGLVDGNTYSYTATASDAAGNSAASAPFAFTLDTATSVSAIADASVTTGSDGKAYINAAHFNGGATTLTGTAEAGDTVVVRNAANRVVGMAQADATTGAWLLSITGLRDGRSYAFTATATDAAGNRATNAPFTFIVDAGIPAVSIRSAGGNVTNPRQTIAGTGVAGAVVTLFDGASALGGVVTVDRFGRWSETVLLPSLGVNNITASETDAAGNVGVSQVDRLKLLAGPPTFVSGGGGSRATYWVNPGAAFVTTVNAIASPGDGVTYALLDDHGRPQAAVGPFAIDPSTGALSLTGAAPSGAYAATIVAIDSTTGETAQQSVSIDAASSLFGSRGFELMRGDQLAGVTDTFVFEPNLPLDLVEGCRATDSRHRGNDYPHDVLAFDHTLFHGATAGESSAQFAAIIATHSCGFRDSTLIYTDTGGDVALAGVNRAALLANPANFSVL